MSASAPRSKPPGGEANRSGDPARPKLAPPARPSPVGPHLPSPDPVRARRATLVSPIPALLAASMSEVRDEDREPNDGTPQPVDARADATSQIDADDQRKLMMDDDDYVVEVDRGK